MNIDFPLHEIILTDVNTASSKNLNKRFEKNQNKMIAYKKSDESDEGYLSSNSDVIDLN